MDVAIAMPAALRDCPSGLDRPSRRLEASYPPISQAESPIGLEAMLGPSYLFFRDVHHVGEDMLEENYRSAEEIVTFCKEAG